MMSNNVQIFDGFTFFNELDVLQFRLTIMYPVVDFFILVEATETFSGAKKPLYFAENRQIFGPFLDKIIHIVVDDLPRTDDPWEREYFQRNAIVRGLAQADANAWLLAGDVDELIHPDLLKLSTLGESASETIYFLLKNFYFHANYQNVFGPFKDWPGPFFSPAASLRTTISRIRQAAMVSAWNYPRTASFVANAGWHFSYFGDTSHFHYKLKSFSHREREVQQARNLSIEELTRARKGPYDDLYPLNVWAFVNPDTLNLPAPLLTMPSFTKYLVQSVDDSLEVSERSWESTCRMCLQRKRELDILNAKLHAARNKNIFGWLKNRLRIKSVHNPDPLELWQVKL